MGASTSPWPRALLPRTFAAPRQPLQGPSCWTPGERPASCRRLESHPGSGRRGPTSRRRKQGFQSGCKVGQGDLQGLETAPGPRQACAVAPAPGCGAAGRRPLAGEDPAGGARSRGSTPSRPLQAPPRGRLGPAPHALRCPSRIPARPQRALRADGVRQAGRGWESGSQSGVGRRPRPRCPPPPSRISENQWASVPTRQSLWRLDSWVRKGRRFL